MFLLVAGEVGASCAMYLTDCDFVNEIVDLKPGLAEGKALNLRQSAVLKRFDAIVKSYTAGYSKTADSNVMIITSGITRKPGMEYCDMIATNAYRTRG